MSNPKEELTQQAIEDAVSTAKDQSWILIERMLRKTITEWDRSNSENFKLALTIEGERKRGGGTFTLQTKAQSAVELKEKDQTEARIIDYGPTLFDPPEGGWGKSDIGKAADMPGDVIDAEEVGKPVRLLPSGRKRLPGRRTEAMPAAKQTLLLPERTGGNDGKAGDAAETAAKVKTITISTTSIFSSNSDPAQWPRLISVRKEGAVREGEIVRIFMKNPDGGRRFDMGLYKCVSAGPRDEYDRDAGRSEYVFETLANVDKQPNE